MAAVHRLVLSGEAPSLSSYYPSAGGEGTSEAAWPAFLETVEEHSDRLRELVLLGCQTNEVGRCASLVGGFLVVAERFGLPLRVLEMGCSAGLNLRWDRFRYESDAGDWGDPSSPVRMVGSWRTPPPSLGATIEVVERAGCDPAPLDPLSEEGRLSLTASIWPDHRDRLARLAGAIEVAREVPAEVDPEPAGGWVPARLDEPRPGVATVLFHTVVWQYVPQEEREAVLDALDREGARATDAAPVAWLRMEPPSVEWPDFRHVVDLTVWPGGETRRLAQAQPHGVWVVWEA